MSKYNFVQKYSIHSVNSIEAIPLYDDTASPINKPLQGLARSAIAGVCLLGGLVVSLEAQTSFGDGDTVGFEQAYQLAVERSPRARLLEAQIEAAEGQVEQANLRPNPTVGAELEHLLGMGNPEGFAFAGFWRQLSSSSAAKGFNLTLELQTYACFRYN